MATQTAPLPKPPGLSRKTVEALTGYAFIVPYLIIAVIFTYLAMIYTFYISFTDLKLLNEPHLIGLKNYTQIFTGTRPQDKIFWTALANTLEYSVVVVTCQTALALFLAVVLNSKIKGRQFFRVAWYAPSVTSSVVISLVFIWVFQSTGILNFLMVQLFGWAGFHPIGWLTDAGAHTALPALMLLNISTTAPTFMIFFLAALQDIPEDIYEAARLDGAIGFRLFRYITVPMLRPIIFLVVVLGTIGTLQLFDQVNIMTAGGPLDQTTTINYLIYTRAFGNQISSMSSASAMAVILFVIIFALFLVQRRVLGQDNKA
ncbi:MAG: carbohydrate ABC transporter permease [Chloroflexia bacterium]